MSPELRQETPCPFFGGASEEVLSRLAETHLAVCRMEKRLEGNGQPGFIADTERRIQAIERELALAEQARTVAKEARAKKDNRNLLYMTGIAGFVPLLEGMARWAWSKLFG